MGKFLSMAILKKQNSAMTNCDNDEEKQLDIDWKSLVAAGAIQPCDDDDDIELDIDDDTPSPSAPEEAAIRYFGGYGIRRTVK